jgi:hypothetical protein
MRRLHKLCVAAAILLAGDYLLHDALGQACRNASSTRATSQTAAQYDHVAGRRMTARKMHASAMTAASRNIVETAVGPGMQTVTTLVKAVQAADLVDTLQ